MDLSVLDCLIPVSRKYEPVSASIAPSGGDDTDQIGIVELLASFASLKFPIELVLKINFKVFTTPGYHTRYSTQYCTRLTFYEVINLFCEINFSFLFCYWIEKIFLEL